MTKTELVEKMAAQSELTKKDAGTALDAFINVVTETLKADEEIALIGFGTFKSAVRSERQGRNPANRRINDNSREACPQLQSG